MYDREQVKYGLLKRYFGHDSFRSGQEGLIDSILGGRDVLGIMPTGAGKSVCYQLPALMLPGVTVVISPLISLMKDQVNALIQAGIPTAYLNSSLTWQQFQTAVSRAAQGAYKLIYVAPERLDAPSFIDMISRIQVSMIAVDEAHCVSQWGQDFRPSYLNISGFAASLPRRPILAAFTATATDAVKRDIVNMLALRDPYSITTGFDRANLYFAVKEPRDKLAETEKLVRSYNGQSGIIYCATRKNVESVCEHLNRVGIPCTRYHAGLDDEERRRNQDDFLFDRVRVMAATNAFGMGIDKSNVTFVIHYNMPKNLEAYYQEAGRAGRDGSEAVCTLLFSRQDVRTNKFLIDNSNDNSQLDPQTAAELRRRDYRRLEEMTRYCTTTDCLRQYILNYFGEKSGNMCMKCSNCAAGFVSEDVTIASQKILSCVYRLAQINLRMGESFVADVLRGAKLKRIADLKCDKLSTYGIMAEVPVLKIRAITQGLTERGYIRKGEHDELILTVKAKELLFDGATISMPFKKDEPKTVGQKKSAYERTTEEPVLFERLRNLRAALAEKAKVPAFVIFSDATLRDMCRKKPKSYPEFLTVSGVGQTKADRYAAQFTEVIRGYLGEDNTEFQSETSSALSRRKLSQETGELPGKIFPSSLSLAETAERFGKALRCGTDEAQRRITDFLTDGGYITEENGDFKVTPKGGINGIALSTKCTEEGRITVLELKRAAQKLLTEGLS